VSWLAACCPVDFRCNPVVTDPDPILERIVVHLPLKVMTATRVLRALAAEFPDGRWVDDPDGHLAIEVPVADPDDPAMERVRIDEPADGGRQ
jgi:hypothetical protein